jgi:predicted small lipoprotein YifL
MNPSYETKRVTKHKDSKNGKKISVVGGETMLARVGKITILLVLIMFTEGLTLTACGQTGDLYLPDSSEQKQQKQQK